MAQRARLITPRGKTIELTPSVYRQVRRLLGTPTRRRTKAESVRIVRKLYGKYEGGVSLTRALLEEHAAERAREEARSKPTRG